MKYPLVEYFKNCLYFTSGNLYRQIDRLAYESFSQIKIAPSQAFLLMAISEHDDGECNATTIVSTMQLDKSTVSRLLSDLHKRKLIKKKKQGKIIAITLTAEGKSLVPQIHKCWEKLYDCYCKLWGESETNNLNKAIFKFITTDKINSVR